MNQGSTETFQKYNFDPLQPQKLNALVNLDGLDVNVVNKVYSDMVRLRHCEEELIREYHPADEMRCPVHFCVGQEAVPAALSAVLKREDYLFSHHRSHGFYFAKVQKMDAMFAEMYGRDNGANRGRAGSQDLSSSADRFFSGAILAGTVPIAVGAALAFQLNKEPFIAVTATGEGATDEGVYWEALNYAGLKKLPVLFICENNNYSTYSPQKDRAAGCNIAERVRTFGVEARTVFGNDAALVYNEVKSAVEHIRAGKGPIFLEAFTYRLNAHVGPEDDDYVGYRSPQELEHWKKHCPIKLLESRMEKKGWLTSAEKDAVWAAAKKEVAAAFAFAKAGPMPVDADWVKFNWSGESPVADKLLVDEQDLKFNHSQDEAVPGPY